MYGLYRGIIGTRKVDIQRRQRMREIEKQDRRTDRLKNQQTVNERRRQ